MENLLSSPLPHHNRLGCNAPAAQIVADSRYRTPGATDALAGDDLKGLSFVARPHKRSYRFDLSRGVTGFPARPEDGLRN